MLYILACHCNRTMLVKFWDIDKYVRKDLGNMRHCGTFEVDPGPKPKKG